jgi:hypothetical protein
MAAERARLRKYLRVALLVQALGGMAIIALTVPDFIDAQLHPLGCTGVSWCLDFRGFAFTLAAIFMVPVIGVLLVLAWRWRGPRLWPLSIVALIDAAAILLTVDAIVSFLGTRNDSVPSVAAAPPLLLLPALATLALGINLVLPVPLKPILAVSAAGSVLLAASLWFFVIRPLHQSIPGELSLPFSKTAVYDGRDMGCRDYVQGWVDKHECLRATLLVYRGSGDPSKDQATINEVLLAQQRIRVVDERIVPLPVDEAVNRTYSNEVDHSNAGLCLIITDQVTAPPSPLVLGRCGMVTDYADIRSHWPADDAYAIGIIYYWDRQDFRDQPSVTFIGNSFSAQPGHTFTLRVRTNANTGCSIVVVDASGAPLQGLDPKTSDAAGNVAWTWMVDASTKPGRWPITVTCGAASGWTSWYVYG